MPSHNVEVPAKEREEITRRQCRLGESSPLTRVQYTDENFVVFTFYNKDQRGFLSEYVKLQCID